MSDGTVLIVGGTGGLGRELAAHYRERGAPVIITGSDPERAGEHRGRARRGDPGAGDWTCAGPRPSPRRSRASVPSPGSCSRRSRATTTRCATTTIAAAIDLATMKLVGYTETIHTLVDRLSDDSSVVLFGGRAKDRPYPGSTTVTTVNGGISEPAQHAGHRARTDSVQCDPSGDRRRQPVLGEQAAGRGDRAHADRAARDDGRRRRSDRVPARESSDERREPLRRRRLDAAVNREASGQDRARGPRGDRRAAARGARQGRDQPARAGPAPRPLAEPDLAARERPVAAVGRHAVLDRDRARRVARPA